MNSIGTAVAVERPVSQVESNMGRLDASIEGLEHIVSNLVGALTPVMRSEPPSPDKQANAKIGEVMVPLASNIAQFTGRVTAMVEALRSARDRLEL